MISFKGSFTQSAVNSSTNESAVTFGTDIKNSNVFLSTDIKLKPGVAFSKLMLVLGRIVRMRDAGVNKDHSAYQEWVQGEYFKELPSLMSSQLRQLPKLIKEREILTQQLEFYDQIIKKFNSNNFPEQRRRFWSWLYTHNRDAWYVLDPIVSVQPDATFFEAFSLDESTYARVALPHEATTGEKNFNCGTTNIDFSTSLERELSRTRSYRPLHLTVGKNAVELDTGISNTIEKKIDLPETWTKGLVEVQAALSLAPVEINISSLALADVLARLEAQREKEGPRSLIFELIPDEKPKVIVEPWGDVFIMSDMPFKGAKSSRIKVWGRRRLRVLKEILPLVNNVNVRLIDSGMPSFWSVEMEGIQLIIGLSGWTSLDWAARARFSAMIPAAEESKETMEKAAYFLKTNLIIEDGELAKYLNKSPMESKRILQRLCLSGAAMYDPEFKKYRYRQLFPDLDFESKSQTGIEEIKGIELFKRNAVRISSDTINKKERTIKATVISREGICSTVISRDIDSRITQAQCSCSYFRYHKLKQGPCRHIVALSLAGE